MKVAMVAARDFPINGWGVIERRIMDLPERTQVLVRPSVGSTDEIISIYAQRHGYEVIYVPVTEGGRGGTFKRDIDLVSSADQIIAFFHPERIMEGGTGHVVEKAQDAHKPVEAWSVEINSDGEAMAYLVGSGGNDGSVS